MPRKNSAIAALQKLEGERTALDAKQRDLEVQAAQEIGQVILGSGLEKFSKKSLRKLAMTLGELGEEAALDRLVPVQNTAPSPAAAKSA